MKNYFAVFLGLCISNSCCEPIVPDIKPECNSDCTKRPNFGQPIYNYGGTVYLGGGNITVRLDSIGEAGINEFFFCNFPDTAKQNALHIQLSFQPVGVCDADSGFQYAKLIYLRKL